MVRLMLILSATLNLAMQQVNHTTAFVQAKIDQDPNWGHQTPQEREHCGIFIEMPRGFQEPGNLRRSDFTQLLRTGCLFDSDKVICLVYFEDTLSFLPKQEYIVYDVINKLQQDQGMGLEVE